MPEYLAPGVYLEEIDSGAKPIEGVSTSTAGMVGMAERGPVDVPILITSAGEYQRWFGGLLDITEFTDPAHRPHCYLPHAVEGFFTNGGKRVYVVRVLPRDAAAAAAREMFDRAVAGDADTVLLRGAGQGSGMAVGLYLLDPGAVAATERLRVGDGSRAEYMTANVVTAGVTRHLPLSGPLSRTHAAAATLSEHGLVALAGPVGPWTLSQPAPQGAMELFVNSPDDLTLIGPPWLVQLTIGGMSDIAPVTAAVGAGVNVYRLTLNQPLLQAYPAAAPLALWQSQAIGARTLETIAAPGEIMVFATANGGAAGNIVEIDRGTADHEVRQMGTLSTLLLAQATYGWLPPLTRVDHVSLADDVAITAKALTATADPGTRTLSLDDRVDLQVGQTLRIGVAPVEEFVTITAIPGDRGPAPDAGAVTIGQPIGGTHANGTAVSVQQAPSFPGGGHTTTHLVLAAQSGAEEVLVAIGDGWIAGDFARFTTPSGDVSFHRLDGAAVPAAPGLVTLTTNLTRSHQAGEPAAERRPLFQVVALDHGAWGNRLLVSAEDEPSGLASRAQAQVLTPPLQFTVTSLTGIEAGTLLEITNPNTGNFTLQKVRRVDRAASAVILDPPGLDALTLAALGPIVSPLEIRSREFRLIVRLRRRPDPAVPSRNNQVLASQIHRHLSMDHRHSRYFQTLIGSVNGPLRLEDRRPEGESDYVRVLDLAANAAATEAVRLGPEALVDLLPGGVREPARHALTGGDDGLAAMSDLIYLGNDDPDPLNRTGLAALRNIPQVSLVSIPGQANAQLQAGLIAHCELMRYRFAVLDSTMPQASLADVQAQRQQFDTKYAALYYPWLTIPDPLPANLAAIGQFALPPSGHILGIFARTDEERGVHKAPANEVVRGIVGLTRTLQKGEHDILNPTPVNINVIRDFRPDGRSIRVWGARCITSDTDHKYVPVRRLLIFLEQSIERGLQWVVFEPNADPLWARVRRTITNFLTDVWRSGALEGTKPEEAFFVKCDRTTMTQTDIDNGRLICVIGVAPVKPAEFVIIRIGLYTRNAEE